MIIQCMYRLRAAGLFFLIEKIPFCDLQNKKFIFAAVCNEDLSKESKEAPGQLSLRKR